MPPYARADHDFGNLGTRRLSRLSAHVPAALVLIGTLVAFVLCGLVLLRHPGVPYNLRELIASRLPVLTLGVLGLCLLITGATPLFLAWLWDRRPSEFAWVGPLNGISVAALIYALLRMAVPYESISDIIGSPVLELPGELEDLGRFVGLYLGIVVGLTFGARLTIGSTPQRRDLPGLIGLSAMAVLSYIIVIPYACTDNLVELLRGGGSLVSAGAVLAFVCLLGLTAGAISLAMIRAVEGRWRPLAGAIVLLLASIAMGWGLLLVATTPALTKYGRTFAAREFLFSPDREHYLGDSLIFLRFAVAVCSMITVLSVGMLFGRLVLRSREANSAAHRRVQPAKPVPVVPWRRGHYLCLFALYAGFAIYGSLVPLHFRSVPLSEAWERFRQIPFLELGIESRSDWVANILLFIPLSFFLAGALRVDRLGRYGDLAAGLFIVPACAFLSGAIEFTQIWFPPRTVSQNDIAAEVLGAIAGVVLWSLAGRRMTGIAREYVRTLSSHRKFHLILEVYLVGLIVYSVLPLDLTISPTHLWRKYHDGRILLFATGGSNPMESAYLVLAKTATFVPVGLLVASLLARLKTPIGNVVRGFFIGAALAALIEMAQLLVYSRVTNGADLLWGALGASIGVAYLEVGTTSQAVRQSRSSERPWTWFCLTAAYAVILAVVFWYPFTFTTQKSLILERLSGMARVPFSALYWGTDWNAMTQIARKVLWFIPLGGLLARGIAMVATSSPKQRPVLIGVGLLATLAVAVAIEFVQILLPGKIADLTDIFLYEIGAIIGMWVLLSLPDLRAKATPTPK